MKRLALFTGSVAALVGTMISIAPTSAAAEDAAAAVYGVQIPPGYRDWTVISLARVGGDVNDLRVKLGNPAAIKAYRDGKRPFPDGTIIARLAYRAVVSTENNAVFRAAAERQGVASE